MTTCYQETYSKLINQMASDMDLNGELPSMYCDDFKNAVAALLRKLKDKSNDFLGYNRFDALVDNSRKDGHLLELVAKYIKYDEEDENKAEIAIKIADSIMKSALLYYRKDIEHEVEVLYRRKYEAHIYSGSFEQLPHSI